MSETSNNASKIATDYLHKNANKLVEQWIDWVEGASQDYDYKIITRSRTTKPYSTDT